MFKIPGILLLILAVMGLTTFSSGALAGNVKSLDLQAKNIPCASCALTIKKSVNKMDGVIKTEVSTGTNKIHVEYDGGKVTDDQIIQRINRLGFRIERTGGS